MKYPRAYLVFNNLEQLTNVIRTTPDLGAGDAEDHHFGRVTALLATRRGEKELAQAVRVDQVEGVEWSLLDPAALLAGGKDIPVPVGAAGAVPVGAPARTGASGRTLPPADEEPARARLEKTSIRVETRKLNDLWQLIGELIINKSRLNRLLGQVQGADEGSRKSLEAIADALERITSGMQQTMMETRMVPISVIFSKLSRRVRDLAVGLGKEADLELLGADTEIDRGVVEVLSAPLTHLINNSLDHGLEPPDERERLGKPRRGRVSISARQEGGRVLIEIADDGRGLDLAAIRRKAGVAAGTSDEEVMRLIFRPGLSTKEQVTELAGRGVGMDVVDSTIRLELGGQVLVHTEAGRGTRFSIILPLVLNILNTLIVTCRGQPFAIPVQRIGETVKTTPEEVLADNGSRRLLYRQETIPLLELDTLLDFPPGAPPEERYGVILQERGREVCLIVDQLVEEQELVIKPVDELLNERRLFSGVSVLGDGRVVFILDTSSIEEIGREPGRLHGDPSSAGR